MRRDRAIIISTAVAVIAWILGRRFVQQSAMPQSSALDYPRSAPSSTTASVDVAQPATYVPDATPSDLEPIGDTTNVALIPNAEAMIPDEVLVSGMESVDTPAGALGAIDVDEAVVMDAPSTSDDDAVTVSPVEDVPGITTMDFAEQPTASASAQQQEERALAAAMGRTNDATNAGAPDDLIVIEGIGPKISSVLIGQGITTFAQLVDADVAQLSAMLRNAGISTANPTTWPQQAKLARDGQWDALKELQGRIKNGRLES